MPDVRERMFGNRIKPTALLRIKTGTKRNTPEVSSMDSNPLPLLLTISETFTDEPDSFRARVVHAAVHGWMEGHLAAPGHHLDPDRVGGMPNPPFPSPEDERMRTVVEEALRRFSEGEEPGAIAFAAALGWQAGRIAGGDCPGCAPESHQDPLALAMRAGTAEIRFHA
jgi:hypothetical protein